MQMFGLLSLLIVIALAAWWLSSSGPARPVGEDGATSTPATYGDVLDSARDVAGQLEGSAAVLTGRSITLYDGVSVPSDTRVLDLSDRGLDGSLKAEIRHLTELRELDLSDNDFTGVPAEVGQLSRLEVLNLSNNPFTGLPHELGNLSNLQLLDLRGTQYAAFDLDIIQQGLPASTQILTD